MILKRKSPSARNAPRGRFRVQSGNDLIRKREGSARRIQKDQVSQTKAEKKLLIVSVIVHARKKEIIKHRRGHSASARESKGG